VGYPGIKVDTKVDGLWDAEKGGITQSSFLLGVQWPDLKHSPAMDFDLIEGNEKVHLPPIVGDIQLQGERSKRQDSAVYEKTYDIIKPLLTAKLKGANQDFH
jgi:hypothetical protein